MSIFHINFSQQRLQTEQHASILLIVEDVL